MGCLQHCWQTNGPLSSAAPARRLPSHSNLSLPTLPSNNLLRQSCYDRLDARMVCK
jgi:hypothetical protein